MITAILTTIAYVLLTALVVAFFHKFFFNPRRIIDNILRALKFGPMSADELSEIACLDEESSDKYFDLLERQKFIRRQGKSYVLTDEGQKEADRPES